MWNFCRIMITVYVSFTSLLIRKKYSPIVCCIASAIILQVWIEEVEHVTTFLIRRHSLRRNIPESRVSRISLPSADPLCLFRLLQAMFSQFIQCHMHSHGFQQSIAEQHPSVDLLWPCGDIVGREGTIRSGCIQATTEGDLVRVEWRSDSSQAETNTKPPARNQLSITTKGLCRVKLWVKLRNKK